MHQPRKVTAKSLKRIKKNGGRISAITAYDYTMASIVSRAGIDIILVGDSLGMVLQGAPHTLKVTMDQVVYHTTMVSSAKPEALVIADMPYGSYHVSEEESVRNALRFIKEGGAEAVKLEGGDKRLSHIKSILNAEIPVMGHLGLTPQSVHSIGGFRVQGKIKRRAREIFDQALRLQDAGIFALLLESIPYELGKKISETLEIPCIGIGAGAGCDGQILVCNDLLGLTDMYMPSFVRKYASLNSTIEDAVKTYIGEIKNGEFPGEKETTYLNSDIEEFLNDNSKKN